MFRAFHLALGNAADCTPPAHQEAPPEKNNVGVPHICPPTMTFDQFASNCVKPEHDVNPSKRGAEVRETAVELTDLPSRYFVTSEQRIEHHKHSRDNSNKRAEHGRTTQLPLTAAEGSSIRNLESNEALPNSLPVTSARDSSSTSLLLLHHAPRLLARMEALIKGMHQRARFKSKFCSSIRSQIRDIDSQHSMTDNTFSKKSLQTQRKILVDQLNEYFCRSTVAIDFRRSNGCSTDVQQEQAPQPAPPITETVKEEWKDQHMHSVPESRTSAAIVRPAILRRGDGVARLKRMGEERRGVVPAREATSPGEKIIEVSNSRQTPLVEKENPRLTTVQTSNKRLIAPKEQHQHQQPQHRQDNQPIASTQSSTVTQEPPSWALPRGASRMSSETIRSFITEENSLAALLEQLFPSQLETDCEIPRIPCHSTFFSSSHTGDKTKLVFHQELYFDLIRCIQRRRKSLQAR